MLLDWAKTKDGEIEASKLLTDFPKDGHMGINVNDFLEKGYIYCSYELNGWEHRGFFTHSEIAHLNKILDYTEGKIIALNG